MRKVRRWDADKAEVSGGEWLPLESGVQVRFADTGDLYQAGDYWVIPARHADGKCNYERLPWRL